VGGSGEVVGLRDRILELRRTVQDGTILDWLDLARLLPDGVGSLRVETLRNHWHCSQPAVSRRITACADARLITLRRGWGRYKIVWIEQP
jgi:hypothetical protein